MANAFDKTAAKKPASRGKVLTMIALAGVLGFLVFNHFSNLPQAASASTGDGADAAPIGSATEQIARLQENPTKDLLLHAGKPIGSAGDIPPNPFAVSPILMKVHPGPGPGPKPPGPGPIAVGPVRPALNLDSIKADIKLQLIYKEGNQRVALVNNTAARIGATLGKLQVKIVDIQDDRIVCQVPGYGDEGQFEVSLAAKLNPTTP